MPTTKTKRMNKQIEYVLEGREKSIGEETVLQPLPHKSFRFASPFIVLHHLPPRHYAPGSPPERIHPHPHRGFAPVTFLFEGEGYHKDSTGNSGVLKGGEVQWMFAGKGLLHSEGPSPEFLQKGGTYEFVQLWLNVPAADKMRDPFYQQASAQQMPSVFNRDGVALKLASGRFENATGPLRSFTPVTSIFGTVQAGNTLQFPTEEGYWTLLYLLDGRLVVNGEREVGGRHLVVFGKAGTTVTIETKEPGKLLYLSAEPINEPVAAKGNIVMNTQAEVEQAERDYADGRFGQLDG